MNLITSCTNCNTIKALIAKIDESLYKRIRNKWWNLVYSADTYFNPSVYKDLLRYKSILEKRIVNSTYPCPSISIQDVIGKITLLINK